MFGLCFFVCFSLFYYCFQFCFFLCVVCFFCLSISFFLCFFSYLGSLGFITFFLVLLCFSATSNSTFVLRRGELFVVLLQNHFFLALFEGFCSDSRFDLRFLGFA